MDNFVDNNVQSKLCSTCLTTLREFISTGFVGCKDCYKAFSAQIDEYITNNQYSTKHVGKLCLKSQLTPKQKLEQYQNELKQAISEERFEDCANIKQKILALKENLT